MASIFEWASSAVGAVKDAVLNTIIPPAETVPVPQLSSKRPPNKGTGAGAKNKKKKKPASRNKGATTQPESSSDHDPAIPESKITDEKVAPDGSMSESETESKQSEQDTAPSPAELARQEKTRKMAAARKEKVKAKKALLATSVVREMPTDPLETERKAVLSNLSDQLKAITDLDDSDVTIVRTNFQETQKALELFVNSLDTILKEFGRKVPRCEAMGAAASNLRQEIQKIEFAPDRDELLMARKIEQLSALICHENQKVFQGRIQKLRVEAEGRIQKNQSALTKAIEEDNRGRVLGRLQTLYDLVNADGTDLKSDDLRFRTLDLSAASSAALFYPHNILRKLERKFLVIGEQPSRGLDRERRGPARSVTIWGLPKNVEECASYIQNVEMSGARKKTFDRKLFGAIIGRGGAGVTRLEEESGCFLAVDGQNEAQVFAYGPADRCGAAFEAIEKLQVENIVEPNAVSDIPIDPFIARALIGLHRAKVQNVELDTKAKVTVIANPTDGSSPRILIRTRAESMEKARLQVKKELIDGFVHLTFDGPQRAISRLLVPPRNAAETAQSRLLHNEFKGLREALALFVDRIGGRPRTEDGTPPPIAEEGPSGLELVCNTIDVEQVQQKVPDLIMRASYNITRVPVEREQLRIFTPDNRALIEASSQCRLTVNATQQGAFLNLMGLDDAIEIGKKVISEILEREGKVIRHPIKDTEVIGVLLRDRAVRLRSIETEHNVSISIFRETSEATLVGDDESLRLAIEAIDALVEERKARKANMETLQIVVNSSMLPRIIGRQGGTINDIRRTSEVDSINIPNRDQISSADDNEVTITIIGLKDSVLVAQKMIERILENSRPDRASPPDHQEGGPEESLETSPRVDVGLAPRRQRGRGRAAPTADMPQGTLPSRRGRGIRPAVAGYDDTDFPTIEAASGMKAPAALVAQVPSRAHDETGLYDQDIDKEEVEIQAFE